MDVIAKEYSMYGLVIINNERPDAFDKDAVLQNKFRFIFECLGGNTFSFK